MAVLPHEHEPEAEDGLPLAVRRAGTPPDLVTDTDLRNVPDADRDAVMRSNHDATDLLDA